MKALHMVAFALVIIGALNWGLVGLLDMNLVETIPGSYGSLVTVVYALVGLSAVYIAATHMTTCTVCSAKK